MKGVRRKPQNEMKLELASHSVNEGLARAAVSAMATQLDPKLDELTELRTAVSEAVTNAIIHGYRGGRWHCIHKLPLLPRPHYGRED